MATTHVLAGVLVGLAAAALAPAGGPLVLAGALGGLAPDVDVVGRHRRDLHFPVYGSLAALVACAAAVAAPSPATLTLATFLVAAALHAVSDVLGGGLELRPWDATSDRAVYEHLRGRWWRPRRWIRYDGAVEDFFVGLALALPALAALDGPARWGVAALVAVSAVYTAIRRTLVDGGRRAVAATPDQVLVYVPEPLIEDFRPSAYESTLVEPDGGERGDEADDGGPGASSEPDGSAARDADGGPGGRGSDEVDRGRDDR